MIVWLMKHLKYAIRSFLNLFTLKRILVFVGISLVAWIVVVFVLVALIYSTGEQNQAQSADVIIVLGSGLRRDGRPGDALFRRSVWGAQLYDGQIAPVVICTGGVGDGQRRSEASACAEVLRERGVPAESIYLEENSHSTEENAIYAHDIMQENGWHSAVIVTDSFHMLRAGWIFDSLDGDIDHYRSPVPREWVRTYYYVRHFTREIAALHWQAFKEIFNLPVTRVEL